MRFEVYGFGDDSSPCWGIRSIALDQEHLIRYSKEEENNLESLLRAIEIVDVADLSETATTILYWKVRDTFSSREEFQASFETSEDPYEVWREFDRHYELRELPSWENAHAKVAIELINWCVDIIHYLGEEKWPLLISHPRWPAYLEAYVTGGDISEIEEDFPALKALYKGGDTGSVGFEESLDLVDEILAKVRD